MIASGRFMAWASRFRAGSTQSRTESWFNIGNKIVVLDRKPQFGPLKKWLHVYDEDGGCSTVEHSAGYRKVIARIWLM